MSIKDIADRLEAYLNRCGIHGTWLSNDILKDLRALDGKTVLPGEIYKALARGHTLTLLTPSPAVGRYACEITTITGKLVGDWQTDPAAAIDALAEELRKGKT